MFPMQLSLSNTDQTTTTTNPILTAGGFNVSHDIAGGSIDNSSMSKWIWIAGAAGVLLFLLIRRKL